ncbi:prenyltransferase, partial [Candidatus Parcubacteria bacterium]
MSISSLFRRHIALPQEHGSWVFLLSPLLIGLFAGENITTASLYLSVAALAAFLLRQPVSITVKAYTGRRPRRDLPAARFWMSIYGLIALLAVAQL